MFSTAIASPRGSASRRLFQEGQGALQLFHAGRHAAKRLGFIDGFFYGKIDTRNQWRPWFLPWSIGEFPRFFPIIQNSMILWMTSLMRLAAKFVLPTMYFDEIWMGAQWGANKPRINLDHGLFYLSTTISGVRYVEPTHNTICLQNMLVGWIEKILK